MLYVISVLRNKRDEIVMYKVFDTLSHSLMELDKNILINIISNTEIQVVNASIQNNEVILHDWINGISSEKYDYNDYYKLKQSGSKFVILSREKDIYIGAEYRTVDYTGKLTYRRINDLTNILESSLVANCRSKDVNGKLKLSLEDAYIIKNDRKFKKLIDSKYDIFIAKTLMLGHKDMTFNYEIENDEVRITKYTGTDTEVILPSFITTIEKESFAFKDIKKLDLNEGLKVIGNEAFIAVGEDNLLDQVEIPSTVELIGVGAFHGNIKLFKKDNTLNTEKFKLRNNKTMVLGQYTPRRQDTGW